MIYPFCAAWSANPVTCNYKSEGPLPMSQEKVISVILNAHLPFVYPPGFPQEIRFPEGNTFSEGRSHQAPPENIPFSFEESWFFEALSETYLPLLEMFDRLDSDRVPFKVAFSLSPVLAAMLSDEIMIGTVSGLCGPADRIRRAGTGPYR